MNTAQLNVRSSRPAPRRGRVPARREEGLVMLVVMVILLVATASAAMAIQATQTELRAAGQERQAVQTRYLAESGLMATLAYLDITANSSDLLSLRRAYAFPNPAPAMGVFAEPEYSFTTLTGQGGTRHDAFRLTSLTERDVNVSAGEEVSGVITTPQVSVTGGTGGGAGGTGGSVSAASVIDHYGSLGPNQAYSPFDNDGNAYIADVNDCVDVKTATAGNEVENASTVVLHCSVTIRARTQVPLDPNNSDHNLLRRQWNVADILYTQNPFTTAHDMRATVTLPPMLIQ